LIGTINNFVASGKRYRNNGKRKRTRQRAPTLVVYLGKAEVTTVQYHHYRCKKRWRKWVPKGGGAPILGSWARGVMRPQSTGKNRQSRGENEARTKKQAKKKNRNLRKKKR